MAPEHLRALIGRSADLAARVDHRSDIYSLGMVLAEMLTGHKPVRPERELLGRSRSRSRRWRWSGARATPSLRAERPDVPWGLESIVRKCLAPDPRRGTSRPTTSPRTSGGSSTTAR